MSDLYTVLAEFRTTPANRAEFLSICEADATASVAHEPGCRAFHVLEPFDQPNTVVLYEIYEDEAAFKAHQGMPHFQPFAEGLERLGIETVGVRFLQRLVG